MDRATITLQGIDYRVEFNWNTISQFLRATGKDDMKALINWSLPPSEVPVFLQCALKEGARLDGASFDMSVEELGSMLDVAKVFEFLGIFNAHIGASTARGKEETDAAKKKSIFRHSGK